MPRRRQGNSAGHSCAAQSIETHLRKNAPGSSRRVRCPNADGPHVCAALRDAARRKVRVAVCGLQPFAFMALAS